MLIALLLATQQCTQMPTPEDAPNRFICTRLEEICEIRVFPDGTMTQNCFRSGENPIALIESEIRNYETD